MKKAMESVTVVAEAPGFGGALGVPVFGNSATLRDAKSVELIDLASFRNDVVGFVEYRSSLLHDAQVGIQFFTPPEEMRQHRLPGPQPLVPQDTLNITMAGSAVATEYDTFTVLYDELGGIDANLLSSADVLKRIESVYCPRVAMFSNGSINTEYGAPVTISAVQDQLKANREYAVLGASFQLNAINPGIRITAPDWGNLGIVLPAFTGDPARSANYLFAMSERLKVDCIPVFNASNKDTVLVDAIAPVLTENVVAYVILALLKKSGRR